MAGNNTPLTFTVRRHAPELIAPAKPTPQELKPLSDIDDQETLRVHNSVIMVYRGDPKMRNKNPASVIREALAKLLVFYYPFAGRLREGPAGKLMVDCSGEGVLFIEAEADVTLDQFGDALLPPFPCLEELLYDVPGTGSILGSPLLLIQVTRLLCEGFILAIQVNHTMCDGVGFMQFLSGLVEIVRGASSPSTLPVWQRELLCLSHQPPNTFIHRDKLQVACTNDDMVHKSFFFTTTNISALRSLVPARLQSCSTFEVLTACLWRCRAIALQPDPEEEMPLTWAVDARKMFNPPLPVGYYGNVLGNPAAVSKARDLCNKPLGYALELLTNAKSDVIKLGYIRSLDDLMALKGRLYFTSSRRYTVSDLTRVGFDKLDFGWGRAAYGGIAKGIAGLSHCVPYTNNKGESGIVVPICLPSGAMDKFVIELNTMLPALSKL